MDKEHCMLQAHLLQAQGYTQVQIAQILGVSDRTVRNHLKSIPCARKKPVRASKLDPYKAFLDAQLEKNPLYNGELLYERIVAMGYRGKKTIMKAYVAQLRRKLNQQAVLRFETEPGQQAQVDWKEFGRCLVDGREVKLYAFVMVLGYSRMPFVYFTTDMHQSTLLACHILAFPHFGGVPKEILYDNMRTAFVPDEDGFWHPTKRLAAFALHYGFVPQRCRIRRPHTKGKVERLIGYLDHNFWERVDCASPLSLATLNEQVKEWIREISQKPLAELRQSRAERFAREQPLLGALPAVDFDVRETVPLVVSRESLIRYETNRYSVPPAYIGETVQLLVHPLHRTAELVGPKGHIRFVELAEPGSHTTVFFPEDRQALLARWKAEQKHVLRLTRSRNHRGRPAVDVEIRPPSVYDRFFAVAEGVRG